MGFHSRFKNIHPLRLKEVPELFNMLVCRLYLKEVKHDFQDCFPVNVFHCQQGCEFQSYSSWLKTRLRAQLQNNTAKLYKLVLYFTEELFYIGQSSIA